MAPGKTDACGNALTSQIDEVSLAYSEGSMRRYVISPDETPRSIDVVKNSHQFQVTPSRWSIRAWRRWGVDLHRRQRHGQQSGAAGYDCVWYYHR